MDPRAEQYAASLAVPGAPAAAPPRREVKLNTLEDLLAEIDRIDAAARQEIAAGVTPGAQIGTRLWVVGEWSVGQILQHLAMAMERSLEGRVPQQSGGGWDHDAPELRPDAQVWTDAAADRLRRVIAVASAQSTLDSGAWTTMHLRHSCEHLRAVQFAQQ